MYLAKILEKRRDCAASWAPFKTMICIALPSRFIAHEGGARRVPSERGTVEPHWTLVDAIDAELGIPVGTVPITRGFVTTVPTRPKRSCHPHRESTGISLDFTHPESEHTLGVDGSGCVHLEWAQLNSDPPNGQTRSNPGTQSHGTVAVGRVAEEGSQSRNIERGPQRVALAAFCTGPAARGGCSDNATPAQDLQHISPLTLQQFASTRKSSATDVATRSTLRTLQHANPCHVPVHQDVHAGVHSEGTAGWAGGAVRPSASTVRGGRRHLRSCWDGQGESRSTRSILSRPDKETTTSRA